MRLLQRLTAMLILMLLTACAVADEWMVYSGGEIPFASDSFLVNEYTGTVTITFLGDCTLGGEEKTAGSGKGFVKIVQREGYGWPFRGLLSLTGTDDITVANLEGVLTDRKLQKKEKEFNFKGPTAYTQILHEGSIEAVTLANNHSHDYGDGGYNDTKEALKQAQVAFFAADNCAVWERDGLKIGFAGVNFTAGEAFENQVRLLQQEGCSAVIVFMHAGLEYSAEPNGYQRAIAEKAVSLGCDLVVGSHPHVVQGFEFVKGVPVLYSLGNCSFGGNANPKDKDALVMQAVLSFEEGALTGGELHFYPVSITSIQRYNNYSPVLLTGKDAQRVLKKMETSTGYEMPPWQEGTGSVVVFEK